MVSIVATTHLAVELPLTSENVESLVDDVPPYLIADGVVWHCMRLMACIVSLKFQGACGSCPNLVMIMKMSIDYQ